MAAVEGLAGGRDDGLRKLLVVAQTVGQANAVHVALAVAILRQDRSAGRAGEIAAHDDFDRQDIEPLADDDIRVGIADHMVRADVCGFLEPVARRLCQYMALVRNRREDDVEGAQPVGRDDDAFAAGQIIVFAHLAIVAVWQFRNESI
ncbi:hypothetical protein D3C87_1627300 [compost metagenome]